MIRKKLIGTAALSLLLLEACNGGGDSHPAPTPTPTPPNFAPAFTSPSTASLVENSTAAYQATATDPNGDPVTFSIAGGADSGRFTISGSGMLSFAAAPNFDLPADANGDNGYEVQLRASDAGLSSTLNLLVTVTNSTEGIRVRQVNDGFIVPHFFAPHPMNPARYFLGQLDGRIFSPSFSGGTVWQDAGWSIANGGSAGNEEMGLLAVIPFPDFATSGRLLVHRTLADFSSEIVEWSIYSNNHNLYRRLLLIPRRIRSGFNHGGWMGFGPDGYLYVATGDGGGVNDPDDNAQNPYSLRGKILRINVDSTSGTTTFLPAPGNPFINGGGDPLVFALGLQNPRRASFDGNRLIITDVGQNSVDEIDLMPLDRPGINFGWPYLEGTTPTKGTAPAGLVAPVLLYPHSAGPRRANSSIGSMVGGFVYRGPIASLQGHYVFADYLFANVYSVPASSLVQGQIVPFSQVERRTLDFKSASWPIVEIAGFGMDNSGNLYILNWTNYTGSGNVLAVEAE